MALDAKCPTQSEYIGSIRIYYIYINIGLRWRSQIIIELHHSKKCHGLDENNFEVVQIAFMNRRERFKESQKNKFCAKSKNLKYVESTDRLSNIFTKEAWSKTHVETVALNVVHSGWFALCQAIQCSPFDWHIPRWAQRDESGVLRAGDCRKWDPQWRSNWHLDACII